MRMNSSRLKIRAIQFCCSLVLVVGLPGFAQALTVSGTITDGAGVGMWDIRVQVRKVDGVGSTLIEEVFTNPEGFYATTLASNGDNVFLRVSWEFPLREMSAPNTGSRAFYNNRFIRVVDLVDASGTLIPFNQPDTAPVNITADKTIDLTLANTFPNPDGNAATNDQSPFKIHLNQAMEMYRRLKGGVGWNPNYDIPVHLLANTVGSSASSDVWLATVDITGTGGGFVSDIYHEMGHLVHYRFNGDSLPPSNCPCHTFASENSKGCAIVEGWPDYTAVVSKQLFGGIDTKYDSSRDCSYTHWLGKKVLAPNPDGSCNFAAHDSGIDNSGEIVEGSVAGFFYHYSTALAATGNQCGGGVDATTNFAENFKVMHDDSPDDFFDFFAELITDVGGAGTAKTLQIYKIMQRHGIVYSRMKLDSPVFEEDDPPDMEPAESGNFKLIDGVAFIRGNVNVKFKEMTKGELNINQSTIVEKARVGWKSAANGSDEDLDPTTISPTFSFAPFIDVGLGKQDLDTATMGGDKDYDLIVEGKNDDEFEDNFDPEWGWVPNDPDSSDERYLKKVGAWFDVNRDAKSSTAPATLDDEGKVIVDNNAPTAGAFKP